MKLIDYAYVPDDVRRSMQRFIDKTPRLTPHRIENCELPHGCTPVHATVGFYKKEAQYVIYLDRAVRYSGSNQQLKKLCEWSKLVFANFNDMTRFFDSLIGENAPITPPSRKKPPSTPQRNNVVRDNSGAYDTNPVINMDEVTIPAEAVQKPLNYKDIQHELSKNVMGQDAALETIAFKSAQHHNKKNPKKPLSIVAYGPPGTGKSEAAKALAKTMSKLSGQPYAVQWVDLNTYTEAHSVHKLTGAPPGYVGYDDTPVFETVVQNPRTVFILDELDKAHPEVLKVFMAILDEGRLAARKQLPNGTREYSFNHSVFFFTSNYRLSEPKKRIGFGFSDVEDVKCADDAIEVSYTEETPENEQAEVTKRIYKETEAARKAFVDAGNLREIASRFNCFVEFKELSAEAKVRILAKQIIETGFEYNIRLTHISSTILQALIDAATTENALTVRSFKNVIEGYLSAAFAEAGANYGGQTVRLEGTIDAPEVVPE